MKVIKQILILFVCLISTTAFPQTRIVDSLVQKVNLAKTSDEKLQALLILCEQHQNIEKNSLLEYAILTQGLVKQGSKENKGLAAIAYINALMRFDKTDTAKSIIDALLPDYSVKNERERPLFFRLSELKSDCYTTVSNYRDAVSIIYTTIKEAEKYKDTLVLATGYNSLGEIAYNRNMLEEARQWQYKALAITQQQPRFYAPAAVANINLGIVYNWMEALDSARYCADQSIAISQSIQNLYYLCNAYMVIATNYRHKKNYTEAERWMLQISSGEPGAKLARPMASSIACWTTAIHRRFDRCAKTRAACSCRIPGPRPFVPQKIRWALPTICCRATQPVSR